MRAFRSCSSLTEVKVSSEFIFPAERHIFDGCSSQVTSGLNIRSYDIDVLSEFCELEEALNTYAGAYLNGIYSDVEAYMLKNHPEWTVLLRNPEVRTALAAYLRTERMVSSKELQKIFEKINK